MSTHRTPLLLIRHGQTPWNVEGRWQGHADTPLTEVGERQARAIAEALAARAARPWTRIVTSDLQRARSTAEAIAQALGLPIEADPRLRERDVGRWSGLLRDDIARSEGETLRAFLAGDPAVRPGGGENQEELRARALEAVRELVARHAGQSLLVVSHLGLIRSLVPGADPGNAVPTEAVAEEILADVRRTQGPAAGRTL